MMKNSIIYALIFCLLSFYAEAQNDQFEQLDMFYQKLERNNVNGVAFLNDTHGAIPSILDEYKFSDISGEFKQDGTYAPGLPKTDVSLDAIKDKILPRPDDVEFKKYIEHGIYLKKLYVLTCKWRQNGAKDDELAKKIMNSLKWYMVDYAPDRPYWRVTFRFGAYPNSKYNGSILAMLDRIVMNMLPVRENDEIAQEHKDLLFKTVDYSDHLIDLAVGAQNRGVNWRSRFNQITFHYLVKYQLFGESAIQQLKHHFYDGFEYDPNCNISGGMGTLSDGGFWHHGKEPYCLPYGIGDYQTSTDYLRFFEGTPMEFEKLHYKTYEEQLLKKWQYVIINDEWFDLAIVGGKNACQTVKTKAKVSPGTLMDFTDKILKLKKENLNYFQNVSSLKNNLVNGIHESHLQVNITYWNWEYMLHRRPGWYIGFKGLSKETETSEWDQNFHLSSGHTSILRRGNEYWNVRNALRWTALPGITAEQHPYQKILQQNSPGSSGYCNGSTDGKYGVFSFNMEHDNTYIGTVSAKKSAFFFEKGVVNLSTDIERVSAGSGKEIWTSLDNRELNGDIVAQINGKTLTFKAKDIPHDKAFTLKKTSWIWHDSIAYVIPVNKGEKIDIKLIAENRSGIVKEVLPHNPSVEFSHNTFLLIINHGVKVENADAQYLALPGVSIADLENGVYKDYVIAANNKKVQLVYDKENQIVEFAFRSDAKVNVPGFGEIESYGPIVGTMRIENGELISSLANPNKIKLSNDFSSNSKSGLSIAISRELSGNNVTYYKELQQSIINVPTSSKLGYEGQSVIVKVKLQ